MCVPREKGHATGEMMGCKRERGDQKLQCDYTQDRNVSGSLVDYGPCL